MGENNSEILAGRDRKITKEDFTRLENQGDPNNVLKRAKEVLPKQVLDEIAAGKWYGIGKGSVLEKNGFIDKLNQTIENYAREKNEILQESSSQEKKIFLEKNWNYTGVLSAGNRGEKVKMLQMALNLSEYGNKSIVENGVWDVSTRRALEKMARDIPSLDRDLQDGSTLNQIMFDFLYKKIFGSAVPENVSSHDYSTNPRTPETTTSRETSQKESNEIPFEGKFYRDMVLQKPYMRGEDVLLLQQILTEKGYNCRGKNGKLDGVFGPKTSKMLKKFQSEKVGISGDGKLNLSGPTLAFLRKENQDKKNGNS